MVRPNGCLWTTTSSCAIISINMVEACELFKNKKCKKRQKPIDIAGGA